MMRMRRVMRRWRCWNSTKKSMRMRSVSCVNVILTSLSRRVTENPPPHLLLIAYRLGLLPQK